MVDTSIWPLASRRATAPESAEVRELLALITKLRVPIIGQIRQERKHTPVFVSINTYTALHTCFDTPTMALFAVPWRLVHKIHPVAA